MHLSWFGIIEMRSSITDLQKIKRCQVLRYWAKLQITTAIDICWRGLSNLLENNCPGCNVGLSVYPHRSRVFTLLYSEFVLFPKYLCVTHHSNGKRDSETATSFSHYLFIYEFQSYLFIYRRILAFYTTLLERH